MVAVSFVMSSLSPILADKGKQVLEIGLGGGSFDMGLHKIKPEVNITAVEIDPAVVKMAFKWFDVVDSGTHHTVSQDGVKFLENANREGAEAHRSVDGQARREQKYSEPVSGTVVVNLVMVDDSAFSRFRQSEVIRRFEEVFPLCVLMKFPYAICSYNCQRVLRIASPNVLGLTAISRRAGSLYRANENQHIGHEVPNDTKKEKSEKEKRKNQEEIDMTGTHQHIRGKN
ncbi:hypothetical protein OSTOST_01722 [Ostertagia ostertagi]